MNTNDFINILTAFLLGLQATITIYFINKKEKGFAILWLLFAVLTIWIISINQINT